MSYFYYDGPNSPMESYVHNLFQVPLFEFACSVDNQDEICADLHARWNSREVDKAVDQESYATEDTLHNDKLFASLNTKILNAVRNVWDKYSYTEIQPYITSMWANSLGKNASIHSHAHSNSFFSGVWYPEDVEVDTSSQGGCIKFIDPTSQKFQIMPKIKQQTPFNSGEIFMKPKKSMLLLFPSWLEHGTVPNRYSVDPRFSVSFNIWFTGELGYSYGLNRLKTK